MHVTMLKESHRTAKGVLCWTTVRGESKLAGQDHLRSSADVRWLDIKETLSLGDGREHESGTPHCTRYEILGCVKKLLSLSTCIRRRVRARASNLVP